MKKLSFDDVLISPRFSTISTRKDVSTFIDFLGKKLSLAVISSNMDSVTGPAMARAMSNYGAIGSLHRFWIIEENIKAYKESPSETIVSIGLGENELHRAELLHEAGAKNILIDVAHGASMSVVNQVKMVYTALDGDVNLIVGNFANKSSIEEFKKHLGNDIKIAGWKVGIGGGSACTTRVVTGCGWPTLSSVIDCASLPEPIIADGGIRTSGDFSKALAAGASLVMCGKLLAGSDESPGNLVINPNKSIETSSIHYLKSYRGSASEASYGVQNKNASHRTPEGDSFMVPHTGPVKDTLQQLEAGLRSAMSYVGANNLQEFKALSEFIEITEGGNKESKAHGKS